MTPHNRKRILITGIPGTGKTRYGDAFARQFGFTHYDLEDAITFKRFCAGPLIFIENVLKEEGDAVLTWGFFPNDEQIGLVNQFKAKGFKVV